MKYPALLIITIFSISALSMSLPPSLSLMPTSSNASTDSYQSINFANGSCSDTNDMGVDPLSCLSDWELEPVCSTLVIPDINQTSCLNAWSKISRSKIERVFRIRQEVATEDTVTPFRYLSDDGTCAIDFKIFVEVDRVADFTISEQAGKVLAKCVNGPRKGGYVFLGK